MFTKDLRRKGCIDRRGVAFIGCIDVKMKEFDDKKISDINFLKFS